MKNLKLLTLGTGISSIGIIVGFLLTYLFNVLLARHYGPSDIGLYDIGKSIIAILASIAMIGLNGGLMRFIPMYEGSRKHQRGIILFVLPIVIILSFLLSLLFFYYSDYLATAIFHQVALGNIFRIFSISLPFYVLLMTFRNITFAYKVTKYKVLFDDLIGKIVIIALAALVVYSGLGIEIVVYAFLATHILLFLLYFNIIRNITPLFDDVRPQFINKKLLQFSYPLLFSGVLMVVVAKMDTLMIGFFMESSDVGLYSMAIKTSLLLLLGLNAVNQIFSPMIASLHSSKKIEELERLFKISTKWIFSIGYPGLLIILLFSKDIMSLFGEEFVVAYPVLIILGIAQCINCATGPSASIISMIGKSKVFMINQIVIFGINFILNLILIPKYGIIGAAIATALSIIIVNIVRLFETYYFLGIHPYSRMFIKPILVGLGAAAIVYLLPLTWTLQLIIFSIIYSTAYLAFCLDMEERGILMGIISRKG